MLKNDVDSTAADKVFRVFRLLLHSDNKIFLKDRVTRMQCYSHHLRKDKGGTGTS